MIHVTGSHLIRRSLRSAVESEAETAQEKNSIIYDLAGIDEFCGATHAHYCLAHHSKETNTHPKV